METEAQLMWGMLFGAIGFGFFVYGRKQKLIVPMMTGLALLVFPYFMPDAVVLVIVGVFLLALPYIISKLR